MTFARFISEWKDKINRGKILPLQKESDHMTNTLAAAIELMCLRIRLRLSDMFLVLDENPISATEREILKAQIDEAIRQAIRSNTLFDSSPNRAAMERLAREANERVWEAIGITEYYVTNDPVMIAYFSRHPELFRVVTEAP